MNNIREIIKISLLASISVVIGYFESFIPLGIPGVKLGLANIILLLAILEEGFIKSLIILVFRVLIVSFLRGTFLQPVFFMSLCGSSLAFILMYLTSKIKYLSVVLISVFGALAHVSGQILVAYFLVASSSIFYYLPFIALISLGTGICSGFITIIIRKRYRQLSFIN